jgi:ribosome-associated toxin RatA of RatAB toxin-antitoxin module
MRIKGRLILCLIGLGSVIGTAACKRGESTRYSETVTEKEDGFTMKIETVAAVAPQDLYALLTDFEHFPEFIPNCISVNVLERTPNSAVLESKRFIRFLGKELSGKTEYTLLPGKIVVRSVNHPLADFSEEWSFAPSGDGTGSRITYTADSILKIPMPAYLCQAWLRDNFKETISAVEKRALHTTPPTGPET